MTKVENKRSRPPPVTENQKRHQRSPDQHSFPSATVRERLFLSSYDQRRTNDISITNMHLKSSHRPTQSTQEDVPIILFKRGEKRKFLKRPDTYEDMIRVVRRKFDIDEHEVPTFETRSLEVCGDHNVEIDEEVYPLMITYLDEIEVILSGASSNANTAIVGVNEYAEPRAEREDQNASRREDTVASGLTDSADTQCKDQRTGITRAGRSETLLDEQEADVTVTDEGPRKAINKGKGKEVEIAETEIDTSTADKKRSRTKARQAQPPSDSDDVQKKPKSKAKAIKEKEDGKGKAKQKKLPEVSEIDESEAGTSSTGKKRGKSTKAKSNIKETQDRLDQEQDHSELFQGHGESEPASARSSMRRRTPSLQPLHFEPNPDDEEFFRGDLDAEQNDGSQPDDPANLFDDDVVEIEHVPRVAERGPMPSANTAEEIEVDNQLTTESQMSPSSSKDGRWEHVKVKVDSLEIKVEKRPGEEPNQSERDTRKPNSRAGPSNTSGLATFAGRLGRERPDTQSRTTSAAPSPIKPSSRSVRPEHQQIPASANDTWGASQSRVPAPPQSQAQVHDSSDEVGEDGYTPDGKFKVFIEGPKGHGHKPKAEFMTRERHVVRKVLQGACKHFGVDTKRAQLQLLFDSEEDGEMVTHYYKCEKEETMGQAGVKPFSSLRVKLEYDDDDEEEEEDYD
ncbi:hypothetical protein D9758_010779 [Tetrapyrgos nigripes]|uniref:Uncharacterized protein n=1 Tax=Tetrapyrgos nigripes TaxID=182062 RepID=A0A8H5FZH6_9AGAR|nr:hypothetical protein D9758_010779 [Tetrapyrgos nigripes]